MKKKRCQFTSVVVVALVSRSFYFAPTTKVSEFISRKSSTRNKILKLLELKFFRRGLLREILSRFAVQTNNPRLRN